MGNPPHLTLRVEPMQDFGTVLICMDGRPQRSTADYLANTFGVRYLDTITTAGTVRHLAEDTEQTHVLLSNLAVSVQRQSAARGPSSARVAVVAHHDCLGNPTTESTQRQQVVAATQRIRDLYPEAEVIGLWVGETWTVERILA